MSKFDAIQKKANAAIQRKVQEVLHQWSVSGANVGTVLQQVGALLGQAQQLIKSANISTADVQATVQQLLGFSRGLNTSVADVEVAMNATVEDLVNISDADMMAAINQLMGIFNTLGISKADVEFALEASISRMCGPSWQRCGLLVEMGIPHCGIERLTLLAQCICMSFLLFFFL